MTSVIPGGVVPPIPAQQNNARVVQGQVQAQLWPSAQPAASLAQFNALRGISFAVSTPALIGAASGSLPNAANMPCYRQIGNSCGTTTLAEIMTYLTGVKREQGDIDPSIRRMNGMFTAPDDMIQFARKHGLSAEGYNNGTWDQVKNMIDMGCPVQAFVEGDKSVKVDNGGTAGNFSVDGMHYIAITGYGTDPATGEQYVIYHDPNRTSEQRMSLSDFQKMWNSTPFGYHDYFIAYGANGTHLPAGNNDGIEAVQDAADGIANLTNGLNRIYSPDGIGSFLHGFPELGGAIGQTIGGGIGGGMQIAGNWINNEVHGMPVLKNFVQPFGDALSGAGAAIGDIGEGVGESFNDFGSAIESLSHGDLEGFASNLGSSVIHPVEGVVNSIGDTAKSVGQAVEDAFSWL
jgi:predicted double-glycine peptidase